MAVYFNEVVGIL